MQQNPTSPVSQLHTRTVPSCEPVYSCQCMVESRQSPSHMCASGASALLLWVFVRHAGAAAGCVLHLVAGGIQNRRCDLGLVALERFQELDVIRVIELFGYPTPAPPPRWTCS